MASTADYNSFAEEAASVSYLNLLGIGVSVVFGITYIALSAHAMKYIKNFTCKIKIIANRAEDKALTAKDFKAHTSKPKSEHFTQMEEHLKNEVRKSRSAYFWNVFACLM